MVRLAVPEAILPIVAGGNPSFTTFPLPEDQQGGVSLAARDSIQELVQDTHVLAIGPGLGQSNDLAYLLPALLEHLTIPVVLDADGLNNFLPRPEKLSGHAAPVIVTPHQGEMSRLIQRDIAFVQANRQEVAVEFSQKHKLIVVLKGHETVVTDGERLYINTTGNPGLATGGTGDILTGLIAALLGQMDDPFSAAQLGVYLHGLAGDLAAAEKGPVSLIATDLLDHLPSAFKSLD